MRVVLGALFRYAIWYAALFWIMNCLAGISRTTTVVAVPFIIVTGVSLGSWRFYRGIHRRRGRTHQARLRGPVRQAGAASGARCRAGHHRGPGTCPRCAGPGLSQVSRGPWQSWQRQLEIYAAMDGDELPGPLPGGIRLRYVPREPLGPGDTGAANLTAAVPVPLTAPAGGMTARLYSNPPPRNNSRNAVASGYTRGGQAPTSAHFRSVTVNQLPSPGPVPHPAACHCVACMRVQPSGAIPGCVCPSCTPPGLVSAQAGCNCPSCTAFWQQFGPPYTSASPYAPGGIVPSPPAPAASQPPSYVPPARPKLKAGLGMDGFDGAPLVAGTALGYRWWTLRAPQLHLNPGDAGQDWDPGLLRGVKDFWQPGVNQARCLAPVRHRFELIPHDTCSDGFWAYWEIQQHDMGAANSLPVVGVVRASGQVIMGPRGFRAQKAEIIALHLPFRIQPDLPAPQPSRQPDYQTRALPGSSRTMTHRRFTGRVISYGGGYVPAPFRDDPPPPEPEPPAEEEIRAAADRAEAWMAVIADRLETMYPGAEVCATLALMKAKYPVKSEYAPPEPQVIPCPYCGTPCTADDIHQHVVSNHYF